MDNVIVITCAYFKCWDNTHTHTFKLKLKKKLNKKQLWKLKTGKTNNATSSAKIAYNLFWVQNPPLTSLTPPPPPIVHTHYPLQCSFIYNEFQHWNVQNLLDSLVSGQSVRTKCPEWADDRGPRPAWGGILWLFSIFGINFWAFRPAVGYVRG